MIVKSLRWLFPIVLLGGAYAGYSAIAASAPESEEKADIQSEPTVEVVSLFPSDHRVVITSYGEVQPLESTRLSAHVSGEVISWHKNFITGGIVKRGETLFTIEKDNYEAAVLEAEANLASAQASLIEEQAKAKVAERQAKKISDKQVSDLYLRKPQVLSAQAQVKSARAALKRAKRDLENCVVIAPYDALVIERDIGVGQYVSAGAQVAVLNNVESAEVQVPIAGFDSAFLPENYSGLTATVVQDGIEKVTRNGVIDRDLGVIDSSTRMVNMVVRIKDPYGLDSKKPALKFGSYVEVSFGGKELQHIYKLPQEYVNNRTVWVMNENNELHPRTVNVVRAEGEFLLIASGLQQADQLVLTLPEYPQKGMLVNVAQDTNTNDSSAQ
ncbi:efflux RND transporter periplasmic adaptor subunit [Vibrio profundi]|uniref:efflux RND transporter periplasmic adaptor subunit n=1 Tax=Vibrio profundi TaxID=1774960 RepID=UPI00373518B7